MKLLIIIEMVFLAACGKTSSPEGRLTLRLEKVQQQLDSLKKGNTAILDSLAKLSEEIRQLKKK